MVGFGDGQFHIININEVLLGARPAKPWSQFSWKLQMCHQCLNLVWSLNSQVIFELLNASCEVEVIILSLPGYCYLWRESNNTMSLGLLWRLIRIMFAKYLSHCKPLNKSLSLPFWFIKFSEEEISFFPLFLFYVSFSFQSVCMSIARILYVFSENYSLG